MRKKTNYKCKTSSSTTTVEDNILSRKYVYVFFKFNFKPKEYSISLYYVYIILFQNGSWNIRSVFNKVPFFDKCDGKHVKNVVFINSVNVHFDFENMA